MKKIILFAIVINLGSFPCLEAIQIKSYNSSYNDLDYIHNEIAQLEQELVTKTEKLNACASKNKNFQIAGIATVGLAGAGVTTNISLYSKMKAQKKQAEKMTKKIKTADAELDKFLADSEQWSKNLDSDKFLRELDNQLTDTEKSRLIKLYNNDFNPDKTYNDDTDNILESDKVLLLKIINTAKNSQKTP